MNIAPILIWATSKWWFQAIFIFDVANWYHTKVQIQCNTTKSNIVTILHERDTSSASTMECHGITDVNNAWDLGDEAEKAVGGILGHGNAVMNSVASLKYENVFWGIVEDAMMRVAMAWNRLSAHRTFGIIYKAAKFKDLWEFQ